MKKEMYKTSLKLKTDKEKEKNKLISNLERRINTLKICIASNDQEIKGQIKEIRDLRNKVFNLIVNRDKFKTSYNFCRRQNIILRIIIALLGAIAIIELLIITTV